ncbi:MAG: hypothetical protein GY822_28465 [Deltaproteobacteria bacterium]|nr:hypothetical protein [Deltaproteobacteria bacterium]
MAIVRGEKTGLRSSVDSNRSIESNKSFESNKADAQAKQVMIAAKQDRVFILEEAEKECKQMLHDAVEQGRRQGYLQAENLRSEIKLLEQRMVQEVDGEIVRTALLIAADMLVEEMRARPLALVDLCTAALSTARDAKDVSIRVHPRSAGVLRKNVDKLVSALGRAREVQIREDRKVHPGGVLIQTESGVIDAQIETQLEELGLVLDV